MRFSKKLRHARIRSGYTSDPPRGSDRHEDDHRCPVCQRYFVTGKRGVLVHLQSRSNAQCYEWYHRLPNLTGEPDPSPLSSPPPSSPSSPATPPVQETLANDEWEGISDVAETVNAQFSIDELFPRAEPRTFDNHTVKHPNAASPFGDADTILDDIRKNDEFASDRQNNMYYPFASRLDWEVASWLSRLNVSMELTDEFFNLDFVSLF